MTRNRLVFSQPYLEFLLPLLSTLIFIPVLFNSEAIFSGNILRLFGENFAESNSDSRLVVYALCTFSTLLLSWTVNNLINSHDLFYKSNYLPSLLAVIYTAGIVYSEGMSLGLFSVPLVLLSITNLLNSLGELGRLNAIFNSGFFLGLAILLDAYVMLLIPICMGVIVLFRPIEFRGVVVFLFGVINVFFLLVLLHVIFRDQLPEVKSWTAFYPNFETQRILFVSWWLIGTFLILSLLGLACLSSYLRGMSNKAKDKARILLIGFFVFQLVVSLIQYSYNQDLSFFYFVPNIVYFSIIAYLSILNKYLRGLLNICHLALVGIIFYHLVIK